MLCPLKYVLKHNFANNIFIIFMSHGIWSEGHWDNGFNHFSQCLRIQQLCPVSRRKPLDAFSEVQKFVGLFNIWLWSIVSLGRDESDPLYLIVQTRCAWLDKGTLGKTEPAPDNHHIHKYWRENTANHHIHKEVLPRNHRVDGRKLLNHMFRMQGPRPKKSLLQTCGGISQLQTPLFRMQSVHCRWHSQTSLLSLRKHYLLLDLGLLDIFLSSYFLELLF